LPIANSVSWFFTRPEPHEPVRETPGSPVDRQGPEGTDRRADHLATAASDVRCRLLTEGDATERIQGHDRVHRTGDQVFEYSLVFFVSRRSARSPERRRRVGKGAQATTSCSENGPAFLVTDEEDSYRAAR